MGNFTGRKGGSYGETAIIVVLERGYDGGGGTKFMDVSWLEVDCITFSYRSPILITQPNAP